MPPKPAKPSKDKKFSFRRLFARANASPVAGSYEVEGSTSGREDVTQTPPLSLRRPSSSNVTQDDNDDQENNNTTTNDASLSTPKTEVSSGLQLKTQTYQTFRQLLNSLVAVGDVFPPLKAAAGGLTWLCDTVDAIGDNRSDSNELREQITKLLTILEEHQETPLSPRVKNTLNGLSQALDRQGIMIAEIASRKSVTRAVMSVKDRQDLNRIIREIAFSIDIATFQVTMSNQVVLQGVDHQLGLVVEMTTKVYDKDRLKALGDDCGAEYNQDRRVSCMEGTRLNLLASLLDWATEKSGHRIFWLNGIPGTGKTTLSESFCAILSRRSLLGASFFCSIKNKFRSDIGAIFPSLAKSLARSLVQTHPQYHQNLIETLDRVPAPLHMHLTDQFRLLIVEPLSKCNFADGKPVVVVIDALDECDGKQEIISFLEIIIEHSTKLPTPLKFFVTSRPEPTVRPAFKETNHLSLRLQDIDENTVRQDIALYVTQQISRIERLERAYTPEEWPPMREISSIVQQAGKLFIFASTVCEHIADLHDDPYERLQTIANGKSFTSLGPDSDQIENLYSMILTRLFKRMTQMAVSRIQMCLSLLMTARHPLSVYTYSALLNLSTRQIYETFTALHSVVQVPDFGNDDQKISIYHASFSDYLSAHPRTSSEPWFIEPCVSHRQSAELCIKLMNAQLRVGVSGAQTSYQSNQNQPIPLSIPIPLAYACTSWIDHVILSSTIDLDSGLMILIDDFLRKHFLHWLEALSAISQVNENLKAMFRLIQRIPASNAGLATLLSEFLKFATSFLEPIRTSIPHIYLSAVHLATPDSLVSKLFRPARPLLSLEVSVPILTIHNQLLQLEGHSASLHTIAYSPNGKLIASGSQDQTIRFWDALTGEPLPNPIQIKSSYKFNYIDELQFSLDSVYIAVTNGFQSLMIWEVETRQARKMPTDSLKHTNAPQYSTSFLPDGHLVLFEILQDNIFQLRYYDVEKGEEILVKTLEREDLGVSSAGEDPFHRAAFSLDATLLATSYSGSQIVNVWDISANSIKLLSSFNCFGWKDKSYTVQSIEFSPDGNTLACGSRMGLMCVLCVKTGRTVSPPLVHPGITDNLSSVSITLSSDNRHAVSRVVPHQNQFLLWDLTKEDHPPIQMKGHSDSVRALCFSPDGRYITSASDDATLRIWDVEDAIHRREVAQPWPQSADKCDFILFVPNSDLVAFILSDQTRIHFWDIGLHQLMDSFLEITDPPCKIHSLQLQLDGISIMAGFHDGSTSTWDLKSGQVVSSSPMVEWGDPIDTFCKAFSPDGTYVVMTSTAFLRFEVFKTTSPPISIVGLPLPCDTPPDCKRQSLSFSQSSTLLAGHSKTGSLFLWDVQTWTLTMTFNMLYLSRPPRFLAFSPDSKWIAECSPSQPIIALHNVETGDTSKLALKPPPFPNTKVKITRLRFSRALLAALYEQGGDRKLQLWDLHTSEPRNPMSLNWRLSPETLALSEDGQYLATSTAAERGMIQLWDLRLSNFGSLDGFSAAVTAVSSTGHEGKKKKYLHHLPNGSAIPEATGWLRGPSGELILWVPPELHPRLYLPGTHSIIGVEGVKIDIGGYHDGHCWKA